MPGKRKFLRTLAFGLITALTLPAIADESDPPDGLATINYWRPDGKYEGWGLHAWAAGNEIPGITWASPVQPRGQTADGGIYFQLPLASFGGSQKVNYIIHSGDTKEQGGKDMSFNGTEHRQIWVNSNDPKIYFDKAEAIKARGNAK